MSVRYAFAGDRDVSVAVLDFLLMQGDAPLALLVPDPSRSTHGEQLVNRCSFLSANRIFYGSAFRDDEGLKTIAALELDFIICVHFPLIVPAAMLQVPRRGILNLHPAYLPYNRGWHTPTWAILEGTPIGATLHFMDEGIDTGDIVHQREVSVLPDDTANTLYQRVKAMELVVFQEAWPRLASLDYARTRQTEAGTFHRRRDLFRPEAQRIDVDSTSTAWELLTRLRGLTTNNVQEAAYFEMGGERFRVQVSIRRETASERNSIS